MFSYKNLIALTALNIAALSAGAQNVPDGATAPTPTVAPAPVRAGAATNAGYNRVTTYVPMVHLSDPALLELNTPDYVRKTTEFRDGNNHTFQSIDHNAVIVSGQAKDVITLQDNTVHNDRYSYLPYAVNAGSTGNNIIANAYQAQKAYYANAYHTELYTSFSKETYSNFTNYSYAPGRGNVGNPGAGAVTSGHIFNSSGQVRIWNIDANGLPVSSAWYPARQLFGESVTGTLPADIMQPAPVSITFTDRDGQVVMKEVSDSVVVTGSGDAGFPVFNYYYAITYYVYDEMGRLRYTLPPKAVQAIAANSWAVSATVLDNLCFQYRYDGKGRQSQVRQPGEQDFTDIVYDRMNRVAMRRSALEKTQSVWEVSFYDKLGRAIATSLYSSSQDRDYWQGKVDNQTPANDADITWYFAGNSGEGTAPAETAISGNTMMSYHYFDDYTVADPGNSVYSITTATAGIGSELISGNGAETPVRSLRTQGLPVYSKIRILPAPGADADKIGDWEASYSYYDDKGRTIYTCIDDRYQEAPIHLQYSASQYDFLNHTLITKHVLVNEKSAADPHTYTELLKNEYQAATGRLSAQKHKVDDGPWKGQASYYYNDLGQLAKKVIGDGGETRDYAYNIRGQLQSTNGDYVNTGNQGSASRSFGEILSYDYGFSKPRYDGKISGMLWRGTGCTEHAYGYDYDLAGRLTNADYRERVIGTCAPTNTGWNNTDADYTVSGLQYDKNGNILKMKQRGMGVVMDDDGASVAPVDMDDLSYTYEADGNRLMQVQDADNAHTEYDFRDGANSGNDYDYDPSGNLIADQNKGLGVVYTWFNKPQIVGYANGNRIIYSYDAAGNKLQEKIIEGGNTKVTGYIGNFVYQNDSLQYMLTPEGRTVFDLTNGGNTEQFFIKDHLGNVRSVVETSPLPVALYLATYELAAANTEQLLFDKVGEIREDKPGGGGGDTKAGLLDGSVDSLVTGTSLMLKVMAGDEVEMQVDNYYDGYDPQHDIPLKAGDVISSLTTTLAGGISEIGQREGISGQTIQQILRAPGNAGSLQHLADSVTDHTRPAAYLTYMQFDRRMKLVQGGSGVWQVTGDGGWTVIGTNGQPVKVLEDGYLFITLQDWSEAPVWFDQLQVLFHRGRLKEEDHYYPFGLPMGHIGSTAAGMLPNRRKYQGNEFITETGLNWMSFGARQYDPQVGRFLSIDPLADAGQDMFSPYAAMGNEPAGQVDPNGTMYQPAPMSMNPAFLGANMDPKGGINRIFSLGTLSFMFNGIPGTPWGAGASGAEINIIDQTIQEVFEMIDGGASIDQVIAFANNNFSGGVINEIGGAGGASGNDQNMPTKNQGGFIENYADFYSFMVDKANTESVEVTALEVLDSKSKSTRYWVEPWKDNTASKAFSNLDAVPGYSYKDIVAQYHTHLNSAFASRQDAFFSNEFSIPVRPIGADGKVWETYWPKPYLITSHDFGGFDLQWNRSTLPSGYEITTQYFNAGHLIYDPSSNCYLPIR